MTHTITVRHNNGFNRYNEHLGYHFKVSNSYHYGCEAPHYSVPAIPLEVEYYPDPLVIIIGTMAVDPVMIEQERYWHTVYRSDGRTDWF